MSSVPSVLLILKFVASRAEMLPSVTMLAGVWYVQVWLRLRRAVLRFSEFNTEEMAKRRREHWVSFTTSPGDVYRAQIFGCGFAALCYFSAFIVLITSPASSRRFFFFDSRDCR